MIMRLWGDAPRDEILAIARRLFRDAERAQEDRDDSRAIVHVTGCLSLCDDYPAAEAALAHMFAEARRRGSASMFAAASQLRARQRLWTGPVADAVVDARAAFDVWRGALHMYLHPPPTAWSAACSSRTSPTRPRRRWRSATTTRPPWASSPRGARPRSGALAARRGEHAEALEAFLQSGRRLGELLATNPTVLPWRSEAGLAAQQLGRRDLARTLIADELALAERFGAPRAIGVARRAAGLLERGDAAVDRLRSAVEPLAACGARIEQARALIDLGAAIRRAGRQTEARDSAASKRSCSPTPAAPSRSPAERARSSGSPEDGRRPLPTTPRA